MHDRQWKEGSPEIKEARTWKSILTLSGNGFPVKITKNRANNGCSVFYTKSD